MKLKQKTELRRLILGSRETMRIFNHISIFNDGSWLEHSQSTVCPESVIGSSIGYFLNDRVYADNPRARYRNANRNISAAFQEIEAELNK